MRTIAKNEKHEFALFLSEIPHKSGSTISITDQELVHRLIHILRVEIGSAFIFFNRDLHAQMEVVAISKKSIEILIRSVQANQVIKPHVTIGLPLLKRESFEQALYAATELGANEIQLLITEKSQRSWSDKDFLRAEKIIHAAAEQSKNFSFPAIKKPILLAEFLKDRQKDCFHIFFDPIGLKVDDVLEQSESYSSYFLLIGPEGDLTHQEKEMLEKYSFVFAALTPTILRAYQALTVGLGIFRSFLS